MSCSSPSIDKVGGSFIHLFVGQLLSSHCVPSIVLGSGLRGKDRVLTLGRFSSTGQSIIHQCFSDLNAHTNAEFDSVALGWGLGVYISNELSDDSHTVCL